MEPEFEGRQSLVVPGERKVVINSLKVNGMKASIRKVLKDTGGYDRTLESQIEQVAVMILVQRRLIEELSLSAVVYTEMSREGDERLKVNPLVYEIREQSKLVESGLDKLTMNIKSRKVKDAVGDNLNNFIEGLKDD